MNIDYGVRPLEKLNREVINKLIIHMTISSLRRFGSTSPKIVKVDGNDKIPTLYYIKKGPGKEFKDKPLWSIHALVSDICRFLLIGSLDYDPPTPPTPPDPDKPFYQQSIYRLDQVVVGNKATLNQDGTILSVSGTIKWDTENEATPGNYICLFICPTKDMLKFYPNAVISFDGVEYKLSEFMAGDREIEICYPINERTKGQEYEIDIKWGTDVDEDITIAAPDAILESI